MFISCFVVTLSEGCGQTRPLITGPTLMTLTASSVSLVFVEMVSILVPKSLQYFLVSVT